MQNDQSQFAGGSRDRVQAVMLILSAKEKRLAQLLKSHDVLSMQEIAADIGKSIPVTKALAVSLYRAFGVETRAQFVSFFYLPMNHPVMVQRLSR